MSETSLTPSTAGAEVTNVARSSAAFYAVSDARFFLGLVALINSLRLQGHEEPIYVADCGLNPRQRELLAEETILVPTPAGLPPYLLKTVLPLRYPADVMVLIDADIIATRSLRPLVDVAATGKVVIFKDRLPDRFNDEWGALLGLGALRRQPYANSGFLALPRALAADVLGWLERGQREVDTQLSIMAGAQSPEYAFYFPDQDVLNAVLASRIPSDQLAFLDHALAPHPPFNGLRVEDPETLRCTYADRENPFLLHQVLRHKPWLVPMRPTPYSELLPRLWLAEDVPLRLSERDTPLRFRTGAVAAAERGRAASVALLRETRGRLGLRRYIRERKRARQGAALQTGPP